MQNITLDHLEMRLYLGSVRGYKGEPFTEAQLIRKIQDFQETFEARHDYCIAARVSRCSFVCKDYVEPGFEVVVINYPRFPRTPDQIVLFMQELAEYLIFEMEQNRISVILDIPNHPTINLFERDNAEQSHR